MSTPYAGPAAATPYHKRYKPPEYGPLNRWETALQHYRTTLAALDAVRRWGLFTAKLTGQDYERFQAVLATLDTEINALNDHHWRNNR